MASLDVLLSLNNLHVSFLNAFSWLDNSIFFFLALNNILLSGGIPFYLSTYLVKDILVLSGLGNCG